MEQNTSYFGQHEAAHSNHANKGVLELSVKVIKIKDYGLIVWMNIKDYYMKHMY